MGRLFGTDGIRGKANKWPMTPEVALRVGQALGLMLRQMPYPYLQNKGGEVKVVIGKDTRLSGYMLEQALASGLNSMGALVHLVGPMPTPSVGFLVRNMRALAGIMVSASHNPYEDNGIKLFDHLGNKISEEWEQRIEELVQSHDFSQDVVVNNKIGRTKRIEDARGRYIVHIKSMIPETMTFDGLRIVLDTAHGASYAVAPRIFEELGAEVIHVGSEPNGLNINDKTGALHPEHAANQVVTYRADFGISVDGDSDRVILIDETGKVLNGDRILAAASVFLKKRDLLTNNRVVSTHMANFALNQYLESMGIELLRSEVGDRKVLSKMLESGAILGGEPSGHIIFLDHSTCADGLLTALKVIEIMLTENKKMSELRELYQDYPQVLRNIRVTKVGLDQHPEVLKLQSDIQKKLGRNGRIFMRYSGTEPMLRILLEGENESDLSDFADSMVQCVRSLS